MWFRGEGIGHRVTREWDEFLQREGRKLPPDDEDIGLEVQSEDLGGEPEWEVGVGMGDGTDINGHNWELKMRSDDANTTRQEHGYGIPEWVTGVGTMWV